MYRKILTLGFAIIFTLTLCSCGEKKTTELNESNVKSVMADFLPGASKAYHNILFGGYKADDNLTDTKNYNDCDYAKVADSDFDTIDKVKAETEKYFTKNYADKNLYSKAFDSEYPIYKEFDGKLYVNIDGGGDGGYDYSADSSTLKSADNGKYTVTVDCIDNYETAYTATLEFVIEDGSIKIDNAVYNEK